MKLVHVSTIAGIGLSLALVIIPSAGFAGEYKQCFNKCISKYDGRWSKKNTAEGACDVGCSAAHWTNKKKARKKCQREYSNAKLYIACKDGVSSY